MINLTVKNLKDGYNHHILCYQNNTKCFTGFRIIILKKQNNALFNFIYALIFIIKYIKRNRIQITHSHHRSFDFITYLVSFILNISTITSVHSIVFGKKLISYNSKYLIAVSNRVKTHLAGYFKKSPTSIILINNFADPGEWVVKKNYDSEIFRIGYAGRINENEKGIDILFEAFNNLEILNKKLILAGKIENDAVFMDILRDKVNYLGEMGDLNEFYNSIDVFVLPSRIEPFGIVLLEAGLFSLPVVAARVDGIIDIIDDKENGLLFDPGSPLDLAGKIMYLYNNNNLIKELGKNLNRKVLNNYSKDKIISSYGNLYRNIV